MKANTLNMHGHYEYVYSRTPDAQDSKMRELNLKKLAPNFRFARDNTPGQNPWAHTTVLNGDFILIAEFAENEGPKPVVSTSPFFFFFFFEKTPFMYNALSCSSL